MENFIKGVKNEFYYAKGVFRLLSQLGRLSNTITTFDFVMSTSKRLTEDLSTIRNRSYNYEKFILTARSRYSKLALESINSDNVVDTGTIRLELVNKIQEKTIDFSDVINITDLFTREDFINLGKARSWKVDQIVVNMLIDFIIRENHV